MTDCSSLTDTAQCISNFSKQQTTFDILNFCWAMRLRGHRQRNLNDMFFHFLCLCPLSLTIKLNFNTLKVAYCIQLYIINLKTVVLLKYAIFIFLKFTSCEHEP